MGEALKSLTITGFKSIEKLENLELRKLNVLIGANGAGKSNFLDFFRLLRAMANEGLQKFVVERGGADGFFFIGPKYTWRISAHLEFGEYTYEFDLGPAGLADLMIAEERIRRSDGPSLLISRGVRESVLKDWRDGESAEGRSLGNVGRNVHESVSSWMVYHFHDTSLLAPMRRDQSLRDRRRLRSDASNVAALLMHLRQNHPETYRLIRDAVRMIAPFLDDFVLQPEEKGGQELVCLEWFQKGSDFPFQPSQLSDGTIRFICLATALLQPDPPATILIDEPELGLHPYAIALLADLIQSAAEHVQVVVSTQSPMLLDRFSAEDVIVVSREQGRSVFKRLDTSSLKEWLAEYSVGELWQKNVVDGAPTHE
jgi:predicted ATPase